MKFHEEYYIENAYFFKQASKYCSVYNIKDLNQLETSFLEAIDFRLMVDQDELDKYFDLIQTRSQELQCKKFRVHVKHYEIVDDYFPAPKKLTTQRSFLSCTKQPPVMVNGKMFKDCDDMYHYYHCEEICEDKTADTDEPSFYTLSEGSPKAYF